MASDDIHARLGLKTTAEEPMAWCDACGGEGQMYTSRYGGNDPDVWPTGTCEACDGKGQRPVSDLDDAELAAYWQGVAERALSKQREDASRLVEVERERDVSMALFDECAVARDKAEAELSRLRDARGVVTEEMVAKLIELIGQPDWEHEQVHAALEAALSAVQTESGGDDVPPICLAQSQSEHDRKAAPPPDPRPSDAERSIRREAVNCCDALEDAEGDTKFTIRQSKLVEMVAALASLSRPAEPDAEWQPIETAPKDGTKVDLWVQPHDAFENGNPGRVADAWFDHGWRRHFGRSVVPVELCGRPTHWRKLPTPPAGSED